MQDRWDNQNVSNVFGIADDTLVEDYDTDGKIMMKCCDRCYTYAER